MQRGTLTSADVRPSIGGCFLSLASAHSAWVRMLGFMASPFHTCICVGYHSAMEGTVRVSVEGDARDRA